MFDWKVEEMALMKEKSVYYFGRERIYNCERTTSREDKIAFVDGLKDGKLSYLLELIEKFKKDSETMPKNSWGNVKTASLKAWIRKNDTKYDEKVIDDSYNYGKFYILGCERYIASADTKCHFDTYTELVDEVFHRQLKTCEQAEKLYFSDHDEYTILQNTCINKIKQYGTDFGLHILYGSSGVFIGDGNGNKRKLTIEELKEFLSKYNQLDELVNRLTEENNIKY